MTTTESARKLYAYAILNHGDMRLLEKRLGELLFKTVKVAFERRAARLSPPK